MLQPRGARGQRPARPLGSTGFQAAPAATLPSASACTHRATPLAVHLPPPCAPTHQPNRVTAAGGRRLPQARIRGHHQVCFPVQVKPLVNLKPALGAMKAAAQPTCPTLKPPARPLFALPIFSRRAPPLGACRLLALFPAAGAADVSAGGCWAARGGRGGAAVEETRG